MNNIVKETIKRNLSHKSKEELLDILSDICTTIAMSSNIQCLQNIQSCTQKAADAINANFKELTKNKIDTSASILTGNYGGLNNDSAGID